MNEPALKIFVLFCSDNICSLVAIKSPSHGKWEIRECRARAERLDLEPRTEETKSRLAQSQRSSNYSQRSAFCIRAVVSSGWQCYPGETCSASLKPPCAVWCEREVKKKKRKKRPANVAATAPLSTRGNVWRANVWSWRASAELFTSAETGHWGTAPTPPRLRVAHPLAPTCPGNTEFPCIKVGPVMNSHPSNSVRAEFWKLADLIAPSCLSLELRATCHCAPPGRRDTPGQLSRQPVCQAAAHKQP